MGGWNREEEVAPISFLTDGDEGGEEGWLVERDFGRADEMIPDQ